jgi:hypothetical protein
LDPAGISISAAAYGQEYPAVSFDGANFLVVWEDARSLYDDIYCARVTPAGEVLDPTGIAISTAAFSQSTPAVSSDGTNSLVVWADSRSADKLYCARVSHSGAVLDTAGIPIQAAGYGQSHPAVSFDGTNYLVVWQDWLTGQDTCDIYGVRVSTAGTVVDRFLGTTQGGKQCTPALCRGQASQILLVYSGWAGEVQGKRYDSYRVWGRLGPFPGIREALNAEVRTPHLGSTVVRGMLDLRSSNGQRVACRAELLDAAGRKVTDLHSGLNDLWHLGPGVYFCHLWSGEFTVTTKIVLLR